MTKKPTTKVYNSKFQYYSEHQNLFRPYIFKRYSPHASKWKPLIRLVDEYERTDGDQSRIKLNTRELDLSMKFLEKNCSKRDLEIITGRIERWGKPYAVKEAIFIEYRKAYEPAIRKAERDFERSDYRYDFEFFAVKFGLVKTKEYTKKQ